MTLSLESGEDICQIYDLCLFVIQLNYIKGNFPPFFALGLPSLIYIF